MLMRGRIFSCVRPVTSALKSCSPLCLLSMGMTASVNSMIPIPPMKWVTERHRRMPCDWFSTDSIVDAPVVVSPDIVSKKASGTGSPHGSKMNGSMPKNENTTHVRLVSRKPSRLPISWFLTGSRKPNAPAPTVMAME